MPAHLTDAQSRTLYVTQAVPRGLNALKAALATDAWLDAMCRAHDDEEAAQRGEPSLWGIHDRGEFSGDETDWNIFRDERRAAIRCALKTVGLA